MKSYKEYILAAITVAILIITTGCKKLVEVAPPVNKLTKDNIFSDDVTATAYITGMYAGLSDPSLSGATGSLLHLSIVMGIAADELSLQPTYPFATLMAYYRNNITTPLQLDQWSYFYPYIFRCNNGVAGIEASSSLTPAVKQQLLGEVKFLRALFYFYMVNMYGDLPLITGTDYEVNRLIGRTPASEVWQLIKKDLIDAQQLLSTEYLTGSLLKYGGTATTERVRPTKGAATALLSRVYLYTKEYAAAEEQATNIINNTVLYDTVALSKVFIKNNKEAIWQLQPTSSDKNTFEGYTFIPTAATTQDDINTLSSSLLNAFEVNDPRRTEWVGSTNILGTTYYYAYKYKAGVLATPITVAGDYTEYSTVLRLGEQYLIRAEARARQNKIGGANGAVADLNVIRTRARGSAGPGVVPNLPEAITQAQAIGAVAKERRIELFSEFGHRWLDLKRTETIDAVMSVETPIKGGGNNWESYQQLFPIPSAQILANPSLIGHQNPGYTE